MRVARELFAALKPAAIVLLTEQEEVIAARRAERDNVSHHAEDIMRFQEAEIAYAREIAQSLDVPLRITNGANVTTTREPFLLDGHFCLLDACDHDGGQNHEARKRTLLLSR